MGLLGIIASLARLAASIAHVVAVVVVEDARIRAARRVWAILFLARLVAGGVPLRAALGLTRTYYGILGERLVPPLSVAALLVRRAWRQYS